MSADTERSKFAETDTDTDILAEMSDETDTETDNCPKQNKKCCLNLLIQVIALA